eukprot:g3088.t1
MASIIDVLRHKRSSGRETEYFENDTTTEGSEEPTLSYARVRADLKKRHPRKNGKKHSMCASTGSIIPCLKSMSEFEKYGLGIVQYFKLLKSLIFIYILLIVSGSYLFSIFYHSSTENVSEATGFQSVFEMIGRGSMGNLGENKIICSRQTIQKRENERKTIKLTCERGEMQEIEAWFGDVQRGQCGCPSESMPETEGFVLACPNQPDESFPPSFCRENEFCFLGNEPNLGEPCCSNIAEKNGTPNFDAFRIKVNENCGGTDVKLLIEDYCLGKKSCILNVNNAVKNSKTFKLSSEAKNREPSLYKKYAKKGKVALNDFITDINQCPTKSFNGLSLIVRASCQEKSIGVGSTKVKKENFVFYYSILILAQCGIFLIGTTFVENRELKEVKKVNSGSVGASRYTIFLKSLPLHTNTSQLKRMLKEHFEKILNCKTINEFSDFEYDENFTPKIVEINFGLKNSSQQIPTYKRRGDLLRALQKVAADQYQLKRQILNLERKIDGNRKNQKKKALSKVKKLEKKMKRYQVRLEELVGEKMKIHRFLQKCDKKLNEWEGHAGSRLIAQNAFITFNTVRSYRRALALFPDTFISWILQPLQCRIIDCNKAKCRLSAQPAPDPSDLIWENMGKSRKSRCYRGCITGIVNLIVLFASFVLIYLSKNQKDRMTRLYPNIDCSKFDDTTINYVDVCEDESEAPPNNSGLDIWKYFTDSINGREAKQGLVTCACRSIISENGGLVNGGIQTALNFDFRKHENITKAVDEKFGNQGWDQNLTLLQEFTSDTASNSKPWKLCNNWILGQIELQGYILLSVLGVTIVNVLLNFLVTRMVLFEKHVSVTDRLKSLFKKLLLARFTNTVLVLIFVNMNLTYFNFPLSMFGFGFPIFSGEHSDFSAEWYKSVGTSLVLIAIVNTMMSPVWPIIFYCLRAYKILKDRSFKVYISDFIGCFGRNCCSCFCLKQLFGKWMIKYEMRRLKKRKYTTKKKTQAELEDLFLGPEFPLAQNYAVVLNDLYMTLIFSCGIPILLPIGFFSFLMKFLTHKWAFCNLYRTPPKYDESLAKLVLRLVYPLVFIYLAVSIWMLTNSNLFPVEESNFDLLNGIFNVDKSTHLDSTNLIPIGSGDNLSGCNICDRVATALRIVPLLFIVMLVVILKFCWAIFLYPIYRRLRISLCNKTLCRGRNSMKIVNPGNTKSDDLSVNIEKKYLHLQEFSSFPDDLYIPKYFDVISIDVVNSELAATPCRIEDEIVSDYVKSRKKKMAQIEKLQDLFSLLYKEQEEIPKKKLKWGWRKREGKRLNKKNFIQLIEKFLETCKERKNYVLMEEEIRKKIMDLENLNSSFYTFHDAFQFIFKRMKSGDLHSYNPHCNPLIKRMMGLDVTSGAVSDFVRGFYPLGSPHDISPGDAVSTWQLIFRMCLERSNKSTKPNANTCNKDDFLSQLTEECKTAHNLSCHDNESRDKIVESKNIVTVNPMHNNDLKRNETMKLRINGQIDAFEIINLVFDLQKNQSQDDRLSLGMFLCNIAKILPKPTRIDIEQLFMSFSSDELEDGFIIEDEDDDEIDDDDDENAVETKRRGLRYFVKNVSRMSSLRKVFYDNEDLASLPTRSNVKDLMSRAEEKYGPPRMRHLVHVASGINKFRKSLDNLRIEEKETKEKGKAAMKQYESPGNEAESRGMEMTKIAQEGVLSRK